MTDYAKEPQPEGEGVPPRAPRIALIDGETSTPLSAEAMVIALFALVPEGSKGGVMDVAVAVQAKLDLGQAIGLQRTRVLRPEGNNGRMG